MNTKNIEKAIERLVVIQTLIEVRGKEYLYEKDIPILDLAIDALEREIPMNHLAMEFDHDGRIIYPCGNCGSDINGGDYCPWCGQRVGEM